MTHRPRSVQQMSNKNGGYATQDRLLFSTPPVTLPAGFLGCLSVGTAPSRDAAQLTAKRCAAIWRSVVWPATCRSWLASRTKSPASYQAVWQSLIHIGADAGRAI